jgi:DNA polymerase sigma
MAEQIKFTEEEVQQIQSIRTQLQVAFQRIGELDIRRSELEKLRNQLLKQYDDIRSQEQQVFGTLNQKYGDGNYDPDTNIFTPIQKNEPQTPETEE